MRSFSCTWIREQKEKDYLDLLLNQREVLNAELVATHGLQQKDFIGTADCCFLCKKCDSKLSSIEELNNT